MTADVSIVGVPFLVGVGGVTLAIVVAAIVARHALNRFVTVTVWIVIVALVGGNAAGWVNRYFDYIPTLEELFGRTARDESSVADVARQKTVPTRGKVITIAIPGTTSGFAARDALVYLHRHGSRPRARNSQSSSSSPVNRARPTTGPRAGSRT